ncbi:MAG: hypothetical protein RLY31_2993 [Bacteroidota bacterium]
MKNHHFLLKSAVASLLFAVVSVSCSKDDASFCIDEFVVPINATSGNVTFTLPNGNTYTGLGALPSTVRIGDYEGQLQSVLTNQVPVGPGSENELVHFFDDGKGNTFWTNDKALFLPSDSTGARFKLVNVFDVIDGTGDFECAKGQFVNRADVDFITGALVGTMSGNLCGGCD